MINYRPLLLKKQKTLLDIRNKFGGLRKYNYICTIKNKKIKNKKIKNKKMKKLIRRGVFETNSLIMGR